MSTKPLNYYSAIPTSLPAPGGGPDLSYQPPEHRARKRFLKAFGLVVLGLFAWHLVMPHHYNHFGRGHHGGWRSGDAPSVHEDGTPCAGHALQLAEDDICADWADYTLTQNSALGSGSGVYPHYPHTSHATFKLPISSDRLFVIAQGSLSHGRLNVFQGDDESDEVEVHVVARYHTDEALSRAKVCAMHRGDSHSEDGLGIFTPSHGHWNTLDQLEFTVDVKLPASSNSPLTVKHFDTDIHNFRHSFTDLKDSVTFKKMTLRGSNFAIEAGSLSIEEGVLRTSNGGISGHYNSSGRLELITSNGRIDTSTELHNADEHRPTELVLRTSNANIDNTLKTYSTARDESTGGAFKVSARTSNSRLSLYHPTAPLNSLFHLEARTSNSPANVQVHPTFEGVFHASTSLSPVTIHRPAGKQEDPSGEGRERLVDINVRRSTVGGSVYWGEKKTHAGSVHVTTSNSPLELEFI